MLTSDAQRPIGVFDSGLGGLTVLRALKTNFPNENYIYLGDTARLPYGTKSSETISRYLDQTMAYLIQRKVKALVVACNSASSALIEFPRDTAVPVYNVIEPGAKAAIEASTSFRIGILATRATIRGNAYVKALKLLNPQVSCFQQAAPLLVPLVEEGWVDDPLTNLVLHRYLQPVLKSGIDTLILGCTHYPILRKAIQNVCGSSITLVDSGQSLSEQIREDINDSLLLPRSDNSDGYIEILSTDSGEHFKQQAEAILSPYTFRNFEKVDL
jgi:glutamate racemase